MGNIVWISAYPKSGNTWVRVFIENYIQNPNEPIDLNSLHQGSVAESAAHWYAPYLDENKNIQDISIEHACELRSNVHRDIAREGQGSRFVKSHNFLGEYKGHALHTASVTSGAIYIVRNPLDVVLSMARYFDYSIDQAIDFLGEEMTSTPSEKYHVPQLISSWSLHVDSWTKNNDPSILVLRYEDLLDNPRKYFRKLESFLGLKKDPKRLKNAINHSSFNNLKLIEKKKGFVEKHERANAFFAKGKKNQWKKELTQTQVERVVEAHGKVMERFKYLP